MNLTVLQMNTTILGGGDRKKELMFGKRKLKMKRAAHKYFTLASPFAVLQGYGLAVLKLLHVY